MSTPGTTSTFSFLFWPEQPRPNSNADSGSGWNPESDPKQASGRELAERLRAKRAAPDKWEADHVRGIRPLRLRPPSQRQSVSGSGQGQQAPVGAAQPEESRLAPHDFDPYGWAALLWVSGLVLDHNAYHLMSYFWVVVALVGIVFRHGPHYLFTSGVVVALGYFLLRNYLPL